MTKKRSRHSNNGNYLINTPEDFFKASLDILILTILVESILKILQFGFIAAMNSLFTYTYTDPLGIVTSLLMSTILGIITLLLIDRLYLIIPKRRRAWN